MTLRRDRSAQGWTRMVVYVGLLAAMSCDASAQGVPAVGSSDPAASIPPPRKPGGRERSPAGTIPPPKKPGKTDKDATRATAPPARPAPTAAPAPAAGPQAATGDAMEDRLRRMENAYLRMEQNNQRIQAQYDALLHKYEDLSTKVQKVPRGPGTDQARARTASRTTAVPAGGTRASTPLADALSGEVAVQQPADAIPPMPSLDPQQPPTSGAEGTGGRTGVDQQPPEMPPAPGITEAESAPSTSRMDRIGAGAEGTGGRVSPNQQPAAMGGRSGEEGAEVGGGAAEGAEGELGRTGPDLKPKRHKGTFAFGEGLEFVSDDDEFKLQFHNLTQAEFRGFDNHDLGVLKDQFFIPRQRWYFVGQLTKNVGFYTVINRGYSSLDLLDAFITLRFSDALRFRMGRMKTPYLYEYFSIAEGDLIAPERSIYAGNFALNRQDGFMFLGELFKNQLTYATGLYNGPRRSFQNLNSAVDNVGIVTWRPFLLSEQFKALKYLNIGGTWDWGYESNSPPQPIYFETANDQTSSNAATSLSPTFLTLNSNTRELGERTQWGAHAVWYYKSFFLMGEYGGGRAGYGLTNGSSSVPINFDGWNVTASYFLTGEQITRRVNMVQPRRDFNFNFLKPGQTFSPGAVEAFARYSAVDISRNIFTAGFADPNLWTNHVWATDIGLNWYLNFYTRIFLDWQHAGYGNEITVSPGKFASTTDIYWLRFQIFF